MPHAAHSDPAAVEEVLLRYCRALDSLDWELFTSCFTADCRTTYQGRTFANRDHLVAVMRRLHEPLDSSMHRLSNVEVRVGQAVASSRAYVDALLVRLDHPEGPVHQVAGSYTDELVAEGGTWRIR